MVLTICHQISTATSSFRCSILEAGVGVADKQHLGLIAVLRLILISCGDKELENKDFSKTQLCSLQTNSVAFLTSCKNKTKAVSAFLGSLVPAVSGNFFGVWGAGVGEKLFLFVYLCEPSYHTPHSTEGESSFSLREVCFSWPWLYRNAPLMAAPVLRGFVTAC